MSPLLPETRKPMSAGFLTLTKNQLDSIISHCREMYPAEACGILAGRDNTVMKIHTMKNTEDSPFSYLMDSKEQFLVAKKLREEGHVMVGIYHSHTSSDAYPSQKDIELAFYPDSVYVIVSLAFDKPKVKAFRIKDGKISEAGLKIEG